MAHRFTRREFCDLVWSEPLSRLAPRFGLSDVGLAKLCKRAGIQVPARGYWAKLQAGKVVAKVALPARGFGVSPEIVIGEDLYESVSLPRERLLAEPIPPAPPAFEEDMQQMIERAEKAVRAVAVPKTLERAHPLVAGLLRDDERRREKQRASSFSFSWDGPRFDSPLEVRRLRIISALFWAVQSCGGRPWIRDRTAERTGVRVGAQDVAFKLEEISEGRVSAPAGSTTSRKRPTSPRLRLTIEHAHRGAGQGRSWEDGENARVESALRDVAVEVLVSGESLYRAQLQYRHAWMVRRRAELEEEARRRLEEERRRERERLARLERERLERLFAAANDWRRAADLRAFVEAVRAAKREVSSPAEAARVERWAADALAAADRLDPLCGGEFALEMKLDSAEKRPSAA